MTNESLGLVMEEHSSYTLDQDGLWKKVITELFEPFMLFFAPELYEKLDWSKTPDSLEQELHRTFPVIEGKRYTDKLMKVHLKDGKEQWILAHIEVQGYKDDDFAERMFQYFYRIFDKYQQKIFTIALLADPDRSFKPTAYDYHFYGTTLTYVYNTYKFLDQDEEELLQLDNPFSYVVLAGIYTIASKNNASQRYQFKRRLFELILKHQEKNRREYVNSLLYFIDYLLEIPKEMTEKLQKDITPLIGKEENDMDKQTYPDPPTLKPIFDELREKGKELGRAEGKEEGKAEGKAEGKEEGKSERTVEITEKMLKKDFSDEEILEVTNLTVKELVAIKDKN